MPEQSNDYRVVVFGAGGVGKSSLVLRFVKGKMIRKFHLILVKFIHVLPSDSKQFNFTLPNTRFSLSFSDELFCLCYFIGLIPVIRNRFSI